MIFLSDFIKHLNDKHSLPDICCPDPNDITIFELNELKALYRILEYEWIPINDREAHIVVNKIMRILKEHETEK